MPYINTEYLQDYIAANPGTIFGLLNTLSGSALSQATLFALSIQPYINASIIIQLLTIAIPALERLAKDGGKRGKEDRSPSPAILPWPLACCRASGITPDQQLAYDPTPRSLGCHRDRRFLHRRPCVPHVVGRTNHRVRRGQRHLDHPLYRYRIPIPSMITTLVTGVRNWAPTWTLPAGPRRSWPAPPL